jgi:hypothetical protein
MATGMRHFVEAFPADRLAPGDVSSPTIRGRRAAS